MKISDIVYYLIYFVFSKPFELLFDLLDTLVNGLHSKKYRDFKKWCKKKGLWSTFEVYYDILYNPICHCGTVSDLLYVEEEYNKIIKMYVEDKKLGGRNGYRNGTEAK